MFFYIFFTKNFLIITLFIFYLRIIVKIKLSFSAGQAVNTWYRIYTEYIAYFICCWSSGISFLLLEISVYSFLTYHSLQFSIFFDSKKTYFSKMQGILLCSFKPLLPFSCRVRKSGSEMIGRTGYCRHHQSTFNLFLQLPQICLLIYKVWVWKKLGIRTGWVWQDQSVVVNLLLLLLLHHCWRILIFKKSLTCCRKSKWGFWKIWAK